MLYEWLTQYAEESSEWPMKQLKQLIEDICADGVVTSEERSQLFRFLRNFAMGPKEEPVVGGIYDDVEVIIPDHMFMFTGKLQFGPRKKAKEKVVSLGGQLAPSSAMTRKVDYLVCGDLGNVNFRQSRFGNKIARALQLRDEEKTGLYIVQESVFVEAIVN
jgi:NAD-dependent DNA ligase